MLTVAITCLFEASFTVTLYFSSRSDRVLCCCHHKFCIKKKKVKQLLAFCPKTRTWKQLLKNKLKPDLCLIYWHITYPIKQAPKPKLSLYSNAEKETRWRLQDFQWFSKKKLLRSKPQPQRLKENSRAPAPCSATPISYNSIRRTLLQ